MATSWNIYAKTISLRSVDVCRAAVADKHKVPHVTKRILDDDAHPFHYKYGQKYRDIIHGTGGNKKDGLWLIVGAHSLSRKRVVRSWAKRRMLQALSQQLRMHGFDIKGKKLHGSGEKIIHGGCEIENLSGTADISVLEKCIEYKYEELLRQAGLVAQEIISRCGKRRFKPT